MVDKEGKPPLNLFNINPAYIFRVEVDLVLYMSGLQVMEVVMETVVTVTGILTVFILCPSVVQQSMVTFHGILKHALQH